MNKKISYIFVFMLVFSVTLLTFQTTICNFTKQKKELKVQNNSSNDIEEESGIEEDDDSEIEFIQGYLKTVLVNQIKQVIWHPLDVRFTTLLKKIPIPPPKNLV